jgi:cytochrome c oxidase subunit 1
LIGISSTLTGINFMVTIVKMRAPGMTFTRMPLFIWAQFATAALNMIATTALAAALLALFLERVFNIPFYDPARGGSPLLWQHMFWFYSHPAVYIMILPAFGIVSEVYPTFARKPIFGYKMIAFSSVAIALLGFMVWAHHMFTSGMAPWLQLPFMILTMIIAVPTGIKIFSWLATLWGGKIWFTSAMLFALGFIATFTFGGVTGIFLSAVPVDLHEHGTYFVVAHIHYVLYGGSVLGLFAGIYYWWPKMTGRMMNDTLGHWHFWLTFIAFNVTFMPMHWLGLLGMPRRVATYDPQFQFFNDVASIASFVLAGSTLLLIYNMLWSFRYGPKAGPNPWGARTLEWQISSPPPYYNFKTIPAVLKNPYDFGEPLPYIGLEPAAGDDGHGPDPHAPVPVHA